MNGRGGARPGAGRPPKALRYARDVAAAEADIVAALPELVEILLAAARGGDTGAARYLVDRVLGRVQTQAKPVAEDHTLPFDHPAAEEVVEMRRRRELAMSLTPTQGEDGRLLLAQEHLLVEAETTHLLGHERAEVEIEHLRRRHALESLPRLRESERDPLEQAKRSSIDGPRAVLAASASR